MIDDCPEKISEPKTRFKNIASYHGGTVVNPRDAVPIAKKNQKNFFLEN